MGREAPGAALEGGCVRAVSVLCQPWWDPLEPFLGVCSSPEICLAGETSPARAGLSFIQFLSSCFG